MDYSIHHNFDRKLNALYVDYYYCESTTKLKRIKIVQRTVLKCIKKKKKVFPKSDEIFGSIFYFYTDKRVAFF